MQKLKAPASRSFFNKKRLIPSPDSRKELYGMFPDLCLILERAFSVIMELWHHALCPQYSNSRCVGLHQLPLKLQLPI
jgi:hypothetical protein